MLAIHRMVVAALRTLAERNNSSVHKYMILSHQIAKSTFLYPGVCSLRSWQCSCCTVVKCCVGASSSCWAQPGGQHAESARYFFSEPFYRDICIMHEYRLQDRYKATHCVRTMSVYNLPWLPSRLRNQASFLSQLGTHLTVCFTTPSCRLAVCRIMSLLTGPGGGCKDSCARATNTYKLHVGTCLEVGVELPKLVIS
jgi:hypothetical protein